MRKDVLLALIFAAATACGAVGIGAQERCEEGRRVELSGTIRESDATDESTWFWMSRTDPCDVDIFDVPTNQVGRDCAVGARATAVGTPQWDKEPWTDEDVLVLRAETVSCRLLHTTM